MQPLEVPSMNVLPNRETSRRHLVALVERQHRQVRLEVPEMIRTATRLGGNRRQLMTAVAHAENRLEFLNQVRSVLVTMPMESIRQWDIAPFEAEFAALILDGARELEPYGACTLPELDARLAVLGHRARHGRSGQTASPDTLTRLHTAAHGLAKALCEVRQQGDAAHAAEVAQMAQHAPRVTQTQPRDTEQVIQFARLLNRTLGQSGGDDRDLAEARRKLEGLVRSRAA
jgi:hypothetical protein